MISVGGDCWRCVNYWFCWCRFSHRKCYKYFNFYHLCRPLTRSIHHSCPHRASRRPRERWQRTTTMNDSDNCWRNETRLVNLNQAWFKVQNVALNGMNGWNEKKRRTFLAVIKDSTIQQQKCKHPNSPSRNWITRIEIYYRETRSTDSHVNEFRFY